MTDTPPKTPAPGPATESRNPVGWLRNEIDRLFEDFAAPSWPGFATRSLGPVPALEMHDAGDEYRLTAELPGLKEEDVDLSIADGVLTLSGEKKEESRKEDKGFMLSERRYGSFRRQVRLPSDIDPDKVKAQFKDGVLGVTFGKNATPEERVRKIAIEKN